MSEDTIVLEMTEWAKENVLANALCLYPDSSPLELTKSVNELILRTTDKVMRPKRKDECELIMTLEDIFNNLNVALVEAGINMIEFVFTVHESNDGPTLDIQALCQKKVMTHVRLRSAFLIPMLQKRYREMRMQVKI